MAKVNSKPMRTDIKMIGEINAIREKRIDIGKDKKLKPTNSARITLAITRHNLFKKIKEDIILADLI